MNRILTLSMALILFLTACSLGNLVQFSGSQASATPTTQPTDTPLPPTETPVPTPIATSTPLPPVDYGPSNFPSNVNPLTGLAVSDPAKLERRPISVKLQTFPRDQRPPWAVTLADIVYDAYQNNGLTRLNALYYGNEAEQVGPIRSGRLVDAHIIRMYKAVFVFGGADKRILKQLFNTEFYDRLILEGFQKCPPMCRVDPNGYNYLVTNTKDLTTYVTAKGIPNSRQNLDGMKFHSQTPPNGQAGMQIYNRYSISAYNRWDYDPAIGRYLRYQDSVEDTGGGEGFEPLMDRLTNQQASADNVVILFVPHAYAYKSGNSEIIDIQLNGSGSAIAFREGFAFEVKWNRPSNDSVLFLTFPDGSPYPFKPGNTWYQVMGVSSVIDKQAGGIWRFVIGFP